MGVGTKLSYCISMHHRGTILTCPKFPDVEPTWPPGGHDRGSHQNAFIIGPIGAFSVPKWEQ